MAYTFRCIIQALFGFVVVPYVLRFLNTQPITPGFNRLFIVSLNRLLLLDQVSFYRINSFNILFLYPFPLLSIRVLIVIIIIFNKLVQ
ncbi:hypothetical protein EUTSA_v10009216mg [Eutrema salsugineum]|uniref:Uncharacterized protein n=1 Tax=Eutrema salsugineum TaxID=72664 RepID=V4L1H1_EUTSA|nr:hypothetical protein EUTSA_v10009216mg [Eutrema salsugineum]